MNLAQKEFEERRLALYEREVEAREKQAEALETIARRLFVSAQDPKYGADNIAEAVLAIAYAGREIAVALEELKGD